MVAGEGHDVEARIGQRVGDLDGRTEDRIAFDQLTVLDEDRLLIDAGQIILPDGGADIVEERREIIAALRRLRGPVDAVVDQIVSQRHERHAGLCCLLCRLLCGLLLRLRLLYSRLSLLYRRLGRGRSRLGGSPCVGHTRRERRLHDHIPPKTTAASRSRIRIRPSATEGFLFGAADMVRTSFR